MAKKTAERGKDPVAGEYALIRSDRRSIGIRVLPDGSVQVRAPHYAPLWAVAAAVAGHREWIERQRLRQKEYARHHPEPTAEEEAALRRAAHEVLPGLLARYARQMGVQPTGLTITSARTRFGSCSGKDRVSFSWRLMQYPLPAVEAVVVHELAHIRHKNHQRAFYDFVLSVLPDYYERIRLLKK